MAAAQRQGRHPRQPQRDAVRERGRHLPGLPEGARRLRPRRPRVPDRERVDGLRPAHSRTRPSILPIVLPGTPAPEWMAHGRHDPRARRARSVLDPDTLEATVAAVERAGRGRRGPRLPPGHGSIRGAHERHFPTTRAQPRARSRRRPSTRCRCHDGTLGTNGGPRIDEHARVLRHDGTPIPGLYAAGNASASVFGPAYPGGGATIGPALTFGYLAGRHAASREATVITDVAGTGAATGGNFAGKVAVVTGAASGIGRARRGCSRHGARASVVADIDATGRGDGESSCERAGGSAVFQATDVADPAAVERWSSAPSGEFGRLDFAHNNAGIAGAGADPRLPARRVVPRHRRDAHRRVPRHAVRDPRDPRERRWRDRQHRLRRGAHRLSRHVGVRRGEARGDRAHQDRRPRVRRAGRAGERDLPRAPPFSRMVDDWLQGDPDNLAQVARACTRSAGSRSPRRSQRRRCGCAPTRRRSCSAPRSRSTAATPRSDPPGDRTYIRSGGLVRLALDDASLLRGLCQQPSRSASATRRAASEGSIAASSSEKTSTPIGAWQPIRSSVRTYSTT